MGIIHLIINYRNYTKSWLVIPLSLLETLRTLRPLRFKNNSDATGIDMSGFLGKLY